MKQLNPHGIISLFLVSIAFTIGIIFTTLNHLWLGLIMILTFILFFILVPKQLCSKCPMREKCGHIVLGKISIKLSSYCPDDFNLKDILILLFTAGPLVIVPQFFLYNKLPYLLLFWGIMILSTMDILLFVCPRCNNTKCPLNKNHKRGA